MECAGLVTPISLIEQQLAVSKIENLESGTVYEPSPEYVARMEKQMENLTETRKIDKVEYTVIFPDPAKNSLTAEQTGVAVKAFFAARTGYLLRQDVKSESSTLEINQKLLANMEEMAISLGAPAEMAKEKALSFCRSKDANFRTESTKSYQYGLTDIFKPEVPETPAEVPVS